MITYRYNKGTIQTKRLVVDDILDVRYQIITHGKQLLLDHYTTHHWPKARKRLLLAFIAVLCRL